jgi:hypothetical protein
MRTCYSDTGRRHHWFWQYDTRRPITTMESSRRVESKCIICQGLWLLVPPYCLGVSPSTLKIFLKYLYGAGWMVTSFAVSRIIPLSFAFQRTDLECHLKNRYFGLL